MDMGSGNNIEVNEYEILNQLIDDVNQNQENIQKLQNAINHLEQTITSAKKQVPWFDILVIMASIVVFIAAISNKF
ncbi:hypothetical protein TRFO_01017 [Tritrichomonas foetus]|uniref:Uncharacterized protein n=1 Tax=Tritrichomonas foetus TaxID=1144522 RepID=A0A1J4L6Y1_9EUKA|nr:hypothetical protein TRFO_01017 [Tritrichomonas foetus]|eukprot:OHT17701.1 hypothetical protein TRFO_01017 [Tritrichomonas foetus]